MKLISTAIITLLAAPVFAGSLDLPVVDNTVIAPPAASGIAGRIGGYYGLASVGETEDANYSSDSFSLYGFNGSVGSAANGGFGWQVDGHYEASRFPEEEFRAAADYYVTYGATVHANFDLAGMALGAFVGLGGGEDIYNATDDSESQFWYGVEGAKNFGNFTLAAQLGLLSTDSDHFGPVDGQVFGSVEGRYFLNDNIMITASGGLSTGDVHGSTLSLVHYGIEGTMRLGQSNFYANAGYRGGSYTTPASNPAGSGSENTFLLGVSMMFGGGLRDVYAATPMIDNYYQSLMGIKAHTYD